MFWETIAALLLITGTLPLWGSIALVWGIIRTVIAFGVLLSVAMSSATFDWSLIVLMPLEAFIQGFDAFWSVASWVWNWGKFEHPVWAAIIGLFGFVISSNN